MRSLGQRLLRHLSFANLLAVIALFVALGGVGYAATTINGNSIKKQTIGAGKLKKGTLTSGQVKADALTGSVINESTLSIVPAAQTAVSAQTATSATTAQSATTAESATRAESATTADTATTAKSADTATTAQSADTAVEAETLDGFTPEELEVSCPADTTLFGGVCWDDSVRPIRTWIGASVECGEEGGRLPSLSELVAYVLREGIQVSAPHWSGDVIEAEGGEETVLARDEIATGSHKSVGTSLGFRCVFYQAN
jgi:hypothetical protein